LKRLGPIGPRASWERVNDRVLLPPLGPRGRFFGLEEEGVGGRRDRTLVLYVYPLRFYPSSNLSPRDRHVSAGDAGGHFTKELASHILI
jgi:hypothetical protein